MLVSLGTGVSRLALIRNIGPLARIIITAKAKSSGKEEL